MAIMTPGMFLSQPGMVMRPSYHWPPMTVSTESAMRSRDCSEKHMPRVPMDMPSETPMVLKRMGTRPALATPSLTVVARSFRCMLQGLPSYHTLAMPTWALFMSCSVSPVAYNMACDAPCERGWVMLALIRLSGCSLMAPLLAFVGGSIGMENGGARVR